MTNKIRGERSIEINGTKCTLAMTLGAMAEIEETFGLESIDKLMDIFQSKDGRVVVKAGDVLKLLSIFIRWGGNEITEVELGRMKINVMESMAVIFDTIAAQNDDEEESSENPPQALSAGKA